MNDDYAKDSTPHGLGIAVGSKNISNILSVHEPEICLACLIDEDPKKDIYLHQMRNIIYNF